MRELSLHLLDIAENSISAQATKIIIVVNEDPDLDLLQMSIEDNGKGMNPEFLAVVADPFTTTRSTRKVGLGIPLLKAAAEACAGSLKINSKTGHGTKLSVQFQRSHIDRMPLGDLSGTFLNLLITNPTIHWIFEYQFSQQVFLFDSEPIRNELGDTPMSEPEILRYLRNVLEAGITKINPGNTDLLKIK